MDVDVAHDSASDSTVVRLRGQLDIATSGILGRALEDLHRKDISRIVVDLGGVTFCDSTGLSALVIGYQRAKRAGGYLRLAGPSPFLLRILAVVGILRAIPVYRSTAAALRGDPADAVGGTPPVEPEARGR